MPTTEDAAQRPAEPATRTALLDAARHLFAQRGYARTTVRSVARRAGLHSAMINYWFGGKEELFHQALSTPDDAVGETVRAAFVGPAELTGERLVAAVLMLWRTGNSPLARLARSNGTHAELIQRKTAWINDILTDALRMTHPGIDRPALRANLVVAQLTGLGLSLLVFDGRPVPSPNEPLIAAYAPTVQHYLLEPLTDVGAHHDGGANH